MTTRKQIEANRRNGRKGGPKTPEGKAVSRMNALKHGIFKTAFTEADNAELATAHDELVEHIRPVGPVEHILVDKLAHVYLKLRRCARAEAEYHEETWKPDPYAPWNKGRDGSAEPTFHEHTFQQSVELFGRYDKTLTNQFVKLLHEIERAQSKRMGEAVVPPVAADITVHADAD